LEQCMVGTTGLEPV